MRSARREQSEADRATSVLRATVLLVSAHSFAVGACLLFATRWAVAFGGWGAASPLFFARQAGVFHFVIASAYLVEYARTRSVVVLVLTKTIAVTFLVCMAILDGGPWAVPVSAGADAVMGAAALVAFRRTRRDEPAYTS